MSKKAAKVPDWKKNEVKEIQKLVKEFPLFGLVDMENLPTLQLQRMRKKLGDTVVLKITKKRIIKRALESVELPHIDKVIEAMRGMPALIFTKANPFKLSKTLQQAKSNAPAKPGQTAPNDIVIPAGPTSFAPGPIISELGAVGIKTKVNDGKLDVESDSTIVKEGEEISNKIADILTRFGLEPMEVGLNLILVYENGTIYGKDILAVDEKEYYNNLIRAAADSMALSISVGYVTKDNIDMLIRKAVSETRALVQETDVIVPEKVHMWITEAEREMLNLKSKANIPDEVKAEPKEETTESAEGEEKKAEEAPAEEVKEEVKKDEPPKEGEDAQ